MNADLATIPNALVTTRATHGTGTQHVVRFPTGWGASVVRHPYSYGGPDGLYELGVVRFQGEGPFEFTLDYSTHITNDVLGHLTEADVLDLCVQVGELEAT